MSLGTMGLTIDKIVMLVLGLYFIFRGAQIRKVNASKTIRMFKPVRVYKFFITGGIIVVIATLLTAMLK